MATKQEQVTDQEKLDRHSLSGVIGRKVQQTLGHLDDLLAIQVRHLWNQYFRVNVLIGPDAASAKVAHSYFLAADSNGNITSATPPLARPG